MKFYDNTPEEFLIDVDYYDFEEMIPLVNDRNDWKIRKLIRDGLKIPTTIFLKYYNYPLLKSALFDGRINERDIVYERYIQRAKSELDLHIDPNEESIYCKNRRGMDIKLIECIGVAIGLSVMSDIYKDITEADWDWIPQNIGYGPRFDYQKNVASDGRNIIQVENKGSIVKDNRNIPRGDLNEVRKKIRKKKKTINRIGDQYQYNANVRYGTITTLDEQENGHVKCWLTDPPSEVHLNPRNFRLLNRLKFIRDWLSIIAPRSQVFSALKKRISILEDLNDPFEKKGDTLLNRNHNKFQFQFSTSELYSRSWMNKTFWANKSHIINGPVGGIVFQLSDTELFFAGIQEDLIFLAIEQDFDGIMRYNFGDFTTVKEVECVFNKKQWKRLNPKGNLLDKSDKSKKIGNYHYFISEGIMHYGSGGVVFGVLPIELPMK